MKGIAKRVFFPTCNRIQKQVTGTPKVVNYVHINTYTNKETMIGQCPIQVDGAAPSFTLFYLNNHIIYRSKAFK